MTQTEKDQKATVLEMQALYHYLRKRCARQQDVADEVGLPLSNLNNIIHGIQPSRKRFVMRSEVRRIKAAADKVGQRCLEKAGAK